MAKKFGKFLMVTAALGAVAAGAYYYLQNKDSFVDDDFEDDDDFDNFDEDLDEEADRNYVDLDLEKAEEFKEGLDAAKADASEKVVGAAKEASEAVGQAAQAAGDAAAKAETKVEEFFDDEDDSDGSMDAM
ncbi:MAG: hypothetical protein J6A08_09220 [Lachnospiraceae bacterium]|nr:hypothetical protein [Lachnospiraceae bacterium]